MRAGKLADHLVGVHVRRSAAAGLEDIHHELRIVRAFHHLIRGSLVCRGNARGQLAQIAVHLRSRSLN